MIEGLSDRQDFERMFPVDLLDETGDRWLIRWRGSQSLRYALYIELLETVANRFQELKVLDIGCAQGTFLSQLQARFPHWQYCATDISQNAITWNRSRFPEVEFRCEALPDLTFSPAWFDLICALEVTYYLDAHSRIDALESIARALKPNGLLLLSSQLDGGQRYFSERDLLDMIRSRFDIQRIEYNYAYIYTRMEQPLLRVFSGVTWLRYLLARRDQAVSQGLLRECGRRARAAAWVARPGLRLVLKALVAPAYWTIKTLLGWVWLPRLCYMLTRLTRPRTGRTQIIVLARKPDGVSS